MLRFLLWRLCARLSPSARLCLLVASRDQLFCGGAFELRRAATLRDETGGRGGAPQLGACDRDARLVSPGTLGRPL